MRNLKRTFRATLMVAGLVALPLASGCAGSGRLTAEWGDPAFRVSALGNVMIVGVKDSLGIGPALERAFARTLALHGLRAEAAGAAAPADSAGWWARAADLGADAVLVARVVDPRVIQSNYSSVKSYLPVPSGYTAGWYSFLRASDAEARDLAAPAGDHSVRVEANLYRHPANQLVWSGLSETFTARERHGFDAAELETEVSALSVAIQPRPAPKPARRRR